MFAPAKWMVWNKIHSRSRGISIHGLPRLENAGLIGDAELFRTYLVYSVGSLFTGWTVHIKSADDPHGNRSRPAGCDAEDVTVSILAGWRIEEVARNVAGSV